MEECAFTLDKPPWDQSTFYGRFKYFAWITDPRTSVTSSTRLQDAKTLLENYKLGNTPPNTTSSQLWRAKKLYLSAFHPDSGELQNLFGRMSFQMPGGMLITGAMMQFYKTNTAVVFWQWVNQSFNALVNYTNRNAASDITTTQMLIAYVTATTSAVVTAIGLKSYLAKSPSPLLQRFVPFFAVAAANCLNIPFTRQNELVNGVVCFDENENEITHSRYAAVKGISQVVFSRITMAAPGMLVTPVIMEQLEKYRWMQKIKVLHAPIQVLICGVFLSVMVPTACALFPQKSSIAVEKLKRLDIDRYEELQRQYGDQMPRKLYFNKGL